MIKIGLHRELNKDCDLKVYDALIIPINAGGELNFHPSAFMTPARFAAQPFHKKFQA
ncbi:hypothetical protein FACS1894187_10160 [Synergistales bacterium]|nr:hypothetical protein FACS1894187_10160 [Synergistales bacterium]